MLLKDRALVGLLCRYHRLAMLRADIEITPCGDDTDDDDVAWGFGEVVSLYSRPVVRRNGAMLTRDELPDPAYQVHCSLEDIADKIDDAAEETEDSVDKSVDHRGHGADDAGEQLVNGLEEVLEGGEKLGHLGWYLLGRSLLK